VTSKRVSILFVLTLLALPELDTVAVEITEAVEVAPVWAGHPVGFALLTYPPHQYVAYYDADRRMTVASRELSSASWRTHRLDETIGWDSHNYIIMILDDSGYLHVAGNMHVHPLKYFRTEAPFDIDTLVRVESMVGSEEQRVTYPKFLRGPYDALIFTYRDGSSGDGNQIYNVYSPETRTWRRLLDQPLLDGKGQMNAYPVGPTLGPNGYYHVCWVWRDTPDCATNHHLSYARSRDLVTWERGNGQLLELPMTIETAEVVDPVPAGGGILNGNTKLGFDHQDRPVIAYHKFDEDGFTQLYNARLEDGAWVIYQSSDWSYRWEFSGGGSIQNEIRIGAVRAQADGTLVQQWRHGRHGAQRWRLDPDSLAPVERLPHPPATTPPSFGAVESTFPGMRVQSREDLGESGEQGVRYVLRWETLDRNRDRPREEPCPPPSMLRVYRLEN
jgi:putative BNR repeat neuraminidase